MNNSLNKFFSYLQDQGFQGAIIPKYNPHNNENISSYFEILERITEFKGSVGFAAIALTDNSTVKTKIEEKNKAAIFVDGRYKAQVAQEVNRDIFDYKNLSIQDICNWIMDNVTEQKKIAYDSLLLSYDMYKKIQSIISKKNIVLTPLPKNYLDFIWQDRALPIISDITEQKVEYSGLNVSNKLAIIRNQISTTGADGFFMNDCANIAWLFNLRALKNLYTPAPFIYAYVPKLGSCVLFVHKSQRTNEFLDLCDKFIEIKDYDEVSKYLQTLSLNGKKIYLDSKAITMSIVDTIEKSGGNIMLGNSLCDMSKACKNSAEIQGAYNAHLRHGVSVCQLLSWLYTKLPQKKISELDVVEKLTDLSQKQELYQGKSFATIAGTGANGAIIPIIINNYHILISFCILSLEVVSYDNRLERQFFYFI